MFNPLQARTLSVSGDALTTWGADPVLIATRLSGTEALGKLYRYEVELATADTPTLRRWQAQEMVELEAARLGVIRPTRADAAERRARANRYREVRGLRKPRDPGDHRHAGAREHVKAPRTVRIA